MRKRILALALALALSLTMLSGCTKSPPGEAKIKEDLGAEESFNMYSDAMRINDLEIIKRQTNQEEKTDTVYVLATLTDDTMEIERSCTLTYELYNEGWLLENVEVTEETVTPLAAPEYSVEELTNFLSWQGYTGIQDINVYDQTVDLENGIASYSLTAKDVHKYMTEELDVTLNFVFTDWSLFWDCFDCTVNSSTEDWSAIAGEYIYYYTSSGDYHSIQIDELDVDTSTLAPGGYSILSTNETTLFQHALDSYVVFSSDFDLIYDKGYSIDYQGIENTGDIEYIATGGQGKDIFIGKDVLYCEAFNGRLQDCRDDKNREFSIRCYELLLTMRNQPL